MDRQRLASATSLIPNSLASSRDGLRPDEFVKCRAGEGDVVLRHGETPLGHSVAGVTGVFCDRDVETGRCAMAAGKRRRRARKPRPEDRLDDLSFKIESVKRRWSRGPRWDSTYAQSQVGIESSDHLEITGVTCQSNELGIDRVQLTIYSRSARRWTGSEYLGLCDRMRGDRGLLIAYLWSRWQEVLALGAVIAGTSVRRVGTAGARLLPQQGADPVDGAPYADDGV